MTAAFDSAAVYPDCRTAQPLSKQAAENVRRRRGGTSVMLLLAGTCCFADSSAKIAATGDYAAERAMDILQSH
ncbi:hypothetical protein BDW22DRAFT_1357036 [Trametopsis cervina]|nr:hypothetical protein BDW22DRAFT_1357036 [Trametopsis cervina]